MKELAARAALLSLSRVANQGLLLLAPVVLVRLLSVEEFGRYREFMVYASVMQGLAGLLIDSSLPSLVPAHPQHTWQFVRQTVMLVGASSVLAVLLLVGIDTATGGALVDGYLLPVVAYTLFYVNFDFWQSLWIAQRKAAMVMWYATGRLLMRMSVVLIAAVVSRNVVVIIWSIVVFEFLRMCTSAVSWLAKNRTDNGERRTFWREQLSFSAPLGIASIVGTLGARAGPVAIAKIHGPAPLADYTIGTYIDPIVMVLRNSLSESLLPDIVEQRSRGRGDPLVIWRRATIVYLILMVPTAVVIAGCAETIVITLFTEKYRAAIPVMQIYSLILVRECFDFGILLRAAGQTVSFLQSNALSMLINLLLVAALVPSAGIYGAVTATVIARFCDAGFLGWRACRIYGVSPRKLLDWREVGKVLAAALLAGVALLVALRIGGPGVVIAVAVTLGFCVLFGVFLWTFRVGEIFLLWSGVKRLALRGRS